MKFHFKELIKISLMDLKDVHEKFQEHLMKLVKQDIIKGK